MLRGVLTASALCALAPSAYAQSSVDFGGRGPPNLGGVSEPSLSDVFKTRDELTLRSIDGLSGRSGGPTLQLPQFGAGTDTDSGSDAGGAILEALRRQIDLASQRVDPTSTGQSPSFAQLPRGARENIEQYISTTSAIQCGAATRAVNASPRSIELRQQFANSCLNIVGDDDAPSPVRRLADAVVVFRFTDPILGYQPGLCHGYVANGFLVSARHCFQNPSSPATTLRLGEGLDAVTLSTRDVRLTFEQNRLDMQVAFDHRADVVVIPLKASSNNHVHEAVAPIGPLLPGDQLTLLARHPDQLGGETGIRYMLDRSPLCRAMNGKGSIITHACQTVGGISGAPIFRERDGAYEFVAVHAGYAVELQDVEPELALEAEDVPNYAISLFP